MKLTNARGSEVEVYGAETPEHVFQIQTSSVAFETLSSKLYSDRVTAIIRELACNAYDSHVVAGTKNKPFEVDLPTSLNSEFRIRDFGTGLADEQVLELYCTYFASSKQATNKLVGAFGIGSKSPFSYTQGFTVTSFQGGEKRIYSAYINEDRVPAVVRLSTGTTTEPDGLEVKFPVKSQDTAEFQNKAEKVFEFFNPKPKFNYSINVVETEYLLETKLWKVRKPNYFDTDAGIRVIQGLVPYRLQGVTDSIDLKDANYLFGMDLDIFVPIGTLSPAASRETLTNEPRTVAKLNSLLQQIDRELPIELEKTIPTGTGWEKLNYLAKTYKHGSLKAIATRLARALMADTRNLFGFRPLSETMFPDLQVVICSINIHNQIKKVTLTGFEFSSNVLEEELLRAEYIIVDMVRLGNRKLEQYAVLQRRAGCEPVSVVGIFPKPTPKKSSEFSIDNHIKKSMELITALGSPPVKRLSEIEIESDTEEQSQAPIWCPKYWNPARNGFDEGLTAKKMWINLRGFDSYPDDDPSYYYIRTERNFPIRLKCKKDYLAETIGTINRIRELLDIQGYWIFNLSKNEKVPASGKAVWIDLFEYFEDWASTFLRNNPTIVYMNTNQLQGLSYTSKSDISPFPEARSILTRTSLPTIHKYISAINSNLQSPIIEKAIEENIIFNYTLAGEIYNDIIDRFPLLASARLEDLVTFYIETKGRDTCPTIQRTRLRQP